MKVPIPRLSKIFTTKAAFVSFLFKMHRLFMSVLVKFKPKRLFTKLAFKGLFFLMHCFHVSV